MASLDIAAKVSERSGWDDATKTWLVFFLCLATSAAGVAASFLILGSRITGIKQWGIGLVIAIGVLSISYAAKSADDNDRVRFLPNDLIQFVTQGFAWPSIWPSLADKLGIDKDAIKPPEAAETTSRLWEVVQQLNVIQYLLID